MLSRFSPRDLAIDLLEIVKSLFVLSNINMYWSHYLHRKIKQYQISLRTEISNILRSLALLSLILLLKEIDHDSIVDNEPHEKFHQNFQDFQSKNSTFHLCKISLKFWLYMYLFSSPSVPLLIEQVLNVYLLQLYISLEEDSVMKFYFLCQDQWCSNNTWHPSNVSIIIILSSLECTCFISVKYNEPTSFSPVLLLRVSDTARWCRGVDNTRSRDPPWSVIWVRDWFDIDSTTSQLQITIFLAAPTPHILVPLQPGAISRPSALRNISGSLDCLLILRGATVYLSWIMTDNARPAL